MTATVAGSAGIPSTRGRVRRHYPAVALTLLAIGATLSGVSFEVAGRNIRIDQVAAILLALQLTGEVLMARRELYLDAATYWLAAYFAVALLASQWAPDPRNSTLQTLNLASMAALYPLLTNFLGSDAAIERFWRTFIRAGTLAIVLGLLLFFGGLLGLASRYIEFSASIGYGAAGTMREANIFGSFAALFLVIGIALMALPGLAATSHRRTPVMTLLFVAGAGLIFSFTRASWVAVMLVLLPALVSLRRPVRTKVVLGFVGVIAIVVAVAATPLVPDEYLKYKVMNLVNFDDGTGAGRLQIWASAFDEVQQRPWLGWGTYSFGDMHRTGMQTSAELAWIGNFALTVLHDSGVIGTLLFSIFLAVTVRGGLRDAKRLWKPAPDAAVRLVGLCYGVLALLVAFLATTGFSFAYPWIALGLVGAHRRRARAMLRPGVEAPGLGRQSTALSKGRYS